MILSQQISLGQDSVDSVNFPLKPVEVEEQSKGEVASKSVQALSDTLYHQEGLQKQANSHNVSGENTRLHTRHQMKRLYFTNSSGDITTEQTSGNQKIQSSLK